MKRFKYEQYRLSPRERIGFWWGDVCYLARQAIRAILEGPPKHSTRWVEVKEGEPGYETALFEQELITRPDVFRASIDE